MSFCVTKDANLQQNALQFLSYKDPNRDSTLLTETVGGILSSLSYAWLVNGSRFIVVSCKNGARVGSWDFGASLQDNTAEILGVDEIQRPHGKEPLLAISINCDTSGGIICIFDFVGSKVVRAIQIVEHISSLHIIDGGQDIFNLSGPLRNFDGIFAVGTVGGNVYIVDICRQLCYEGFGTLQARDELNPCQMQVVTSQDLLDIENHKKNALRNDSHLAIHLNVVHNSTTEHFVLKEPNGLDKVHVNKQEVLISALHYCPQLGSILLGYNFGAFQLWNLMSMELVYTSPICDDHVPVSKFAIQEPSDDPRAFCYVWAVYSSDDLKSLLLPYLVMYALCYESKEFHECYGILYENFQYCAVRFHMELGFNYQSIVEPKGGRCLRLESLVLKNSITNSDLCMGDGAEDLLSLCIVTWKAVCGNGTFTYMALFDLNQWYKAQMPNSPNFDDCTSYMTTLCITDLTDTVEERADVFDVAVHKKTLQQFMGTQKLEEHYYPSSLSFDICCLSENRTLTIQYQGIQKALLYQLQSAGPLCLIRPTEIYQEIVSLGLTPLFVEISTSTPVTSLNVQREVILNVALEQQLTSWLCKCASEWANGSFASAGCSLELLTSWAFQRGIVLKKNCDNICIPLFDYSEVRLDTNTSNILNNCIRQIKNISFFYTFVMKNLTTYVTNKDLLSEQCHLLQMVEVYFDVLQWLFNVGLLPEYAPSSFFETTHEDRIRAPYPADELAAYYRKRRSELLLALTGRFSSKSSFLFIDNLINIECGGDQLGKDWKNDGGDGFYPPRSLQALLRTYLMEGIDVCNKHAVVIYLFLDLAMILDPQKYKSVITHLIKFPAVFKVSPSLIKITQAFWQLDHGDFSTAMEQLLDPLVNQDDLKYWHHKVAIKSLLVQEQHNSALLYMHVKKPPILDDEDVLCALSLFVSNNMLDEAFYLEKHFKNYLSSKKFIKHLFAECNNHGRLGNIIYRNLSDEEEKHFLEYLDEVNHPEAADLKITYFMQRSHYIEAFKTYEGCEDDPIKKGLVSRLKLKARDQIVQSYKKLLPTVSYKFIESCTKEPNLSCWKEVSRPEPMSVFVHEAVEKTEYKSSLIFAALAKAKQTFNGGVRNISSLMNATTEEIPFLRTPTVCPSRKRSSVQVIVPTVVYDEENDGPSPTKRPRLSPRSVSSFSLSKSNIDTSLLNTPIVVRKDKRQISTSTMERPSRDITSTPTSILKVKQSYTEETMIDKTSSPNFKAESSNTPSQFEKRTPLLSGRKTICRPSIVRFDVPKSSTPSSEEKSSLINSSTSPLDIKGRTEKLNDSITSANSPKNASESEDVFYSPDSSLNNVEELPEDVEKTLISENCVGIVDESNAINDHISGTDPSRKDESETEELRSKISPKKPAIISEAKLLKLVDYDPSSSSRDSTRDSPRARRSYKKLPNDNTPVRSSPRLSRSRGLPSPGTPSTSEKMTTSRRERGGSDYSVFSSPGGENEEYEIAEQPSLGTSKVKARKSLSRQVLETNALSKLASDVDNAESSLSRVFHSENKDISAVIIDRTKSEFSYTKIEYSDVYKKKLSTPQKSFSETHSVKKLSNSIKEIVPDSDQDSTSDSLMAAPQRHDSFMKQFVDDMSEGKTEDSNIYRQELMGGEKQEFQTPPKDPTPSRRLSRRLSTERIIPSQDGSRSSASKVGEDKINVPCILTPRKSRRLSSERTIPSDDSSKADEDKIDLLKLTARPRISRRLSAERTTQSDDCSQISDNGEKKDVSRFATIPRMSRRLSAERLTDESYQATSSTPQKVEVLKLSTKPRISRRLSTERIAMEDSSEALLSRSETEVVMLSPAERKSSRLSAERTLSSPNVLEVSPSQESSNKSDILKFTPKVKSRKSLSRQVLESNAIARLTSEYQCSNFENVQTHAEKEESVSCANEEICSANSSFYSNNPSADSSRLELSESFLEDIAYINQEIGDECKQTEKDIDPQYNQADITDDLDPQLEEQQTGIKEMASTTMKENEEGLETIQKEIESSLCQADLTDDLDPDSATKKDKSQLESRDLENEEVLVLDDAEMMDDLQIIEEKNENKKLDNSGEVTLIEDTVEVDLTGPEQPGSQFTELTNVKISETANEEKTEGNVDYSMVYEDLSNDSNQNDPEMNVFEISEDLSLNKGMLEEEAPFAGSEITSDLDNMMQESPLPSVFERNIMYSGSSNSDDEILQIDEGNKELKSISNPAVEIIEIGSSSENEENNSSSKSTNSSSERCKRTSSESSSDATYSSNTLRDDIHKNHEESKTAEEEALKPKDKHLQSVKKHSVKERLSKNDTIINTIVVEEDVNEDAETNQEEELGFQTVTSQQGGEFEKNIKERKSSGIDDKVIADTSAVIMQEADFKTDEHEQVGALTKQCAGIISEFDKEKVESKMNTEDVEETRIEKSNVEAENARPVDVTMKQTEDMNIEQSDMRSVELQTGQSLLDLGKTTCEDILERKSDRGPESTFTPSRRMTRRSSRLIEESENESASLEKNDAANDSQPIVSEEKVSLAKRSQRIRLSIDPASPSLVNIKLELPDIKSRASATKSVKTYSRKRTRSVDTAILEGSEVDENSGSTSREPEIRTARRTARCASVEFSSTVEDPPKSEISAKKSYSVCSLPIVAEQRKSKRKPSKVVKRIVSEGNSNREIIKRPSSLCDLPVREESRTNRRKPSKVVKKIVSGVEEHVKRPSSLCDLPVTERGKREIKSDKPNRNLIESYAQSRRLTRRQANLMESTLTEIDEELEEPGVDLASVESEDPIKLLEKTNFEGTPDPEEQKIYETSPSSSGLSASASNAGRARRWSRSSSNASELSNARSELSTTPKKTRQQIVRLDSPVVLETRRKLRSGSADDVMDIVRKTRRNKKKSTDDESGSVASDTASIISTRSKKSSASKKSNVSENSTTSKKRKVASKTNLPEIKEENLDVSNKSPRTRRREK